MLELDIDADDLETVKNILANHVQCYEVWAFGSRVKKTARKFSDLDLAVITEKPLELNTYGNLKTAFSESHLPFKVDIIDWASTADNFKRIIQEKYIVIQKKSL